MVFQTAVFRHVRFFFKVRSLTASVPTVVAVSGTVAEIWRVFIFLKMVIVRHLEFSKLANFNHRPV